MSKDMFFSKQELQCILWRHIYVPGSRHIHICTWKYFGFVSCLQVRKRAVHAIGNCWTIFLGCTCIMVGYTSYSIVLMGCPPKIDLANPMDGHSRRFLMAYKRGHLRFLNKSMPHISHYIPFYPSYGWFHYSNFGGSHPFLIRPANIPSESLLWSIFFWWCPMPFLDSTIKLFPLPHQHIPTAASFGCWCRTDGRWWGSEKSSVWLIGFTEATPNLENEKLNAKKVSEMELSHSLAIFRGQKMKNNRI